MSDKGKERERSPPEINPRSRELMRCYEFHGRYFGEWKKGQWMLPVDEVEKDRLDIMSIATNMARDFVLTDTPVDFGWNSRREGPNGLNGTHPNRRAQVLDLGAGTGTWVKTMSKTYPESVFCGVDLYDNFIPNWLTPRCSFAGGIDIEDPWEPMYEFFDKVCTDIHPGQDPPHPPIDRMNWDLIRVSMLNGGIQCWEDVYIKILNHLRPGSGYVELIEIDWTTRWEEEDSGKPAEPSTQDRWLDDVLRAFDAHGRSMRVNPHTRELLERVGFTDVKEKRIKLPMKPWMVHVDEGTDKTARWFNLAYCVGLQSFSMIPFVQKMGMPDHELEALLKQVKYDACLLDWHNYCVLHVWTGRRPAPGEVNSH